MTSHQLSTRRIAATTLGILLALPIGTRVFSAPPVRKAAPLPHKQALGTFETIQTKQGIEVRENRKPVLFFQTAAKQLDGEKTYRRSHYVHPVYDLAGDTIITQDFPDDHKHHRGIFWAWHQVLVDGAKAGDAWLCRDFQWKLKHTDCKVTAEDGVTIGASTVWNSRHIRDEAGPFPIAQDEVEIHIHPRTKNYRAIDFTIRLLALQPNVRIGGSDDAKGYGGFSTRMRMPADLKFIGKDGPVQPTKLAVKSGRWMKFDSKEFSYAIFNHHKNPGDPTQWILRQKRSMQNAVYPGPVPVALSMEKPTILRYRVLILKGNQTMKYKLPAMLKMYDASVDESSE